MDSIAMLQCAIDGARDVIRDVQAADLTKPTPCTEWDVRGLMNHMAGTCAMFTPPPVGTEPAQPRHRRTCWAPTPRVTTPTSRGSC